MFCLATDFYITNNKEQRYYQKELSNIDKHTIKQLEIDFLKISAYLNACNRTRGSKCQEFNKPNLSLLPEFMLLSGNWQNKELTVDFFIEANIEFLSISQGAHKAVMKIDAIKNKINSSIPRHIHYSIYKKQKTLMNKGEKKGSQGATDYLKSFQLLNNELMIDYWISEKYINSRLVSLGTSFIKSLSLFTLLIVIMYFLIYKQLKYKLYSGLTESLNETNAEKQKLKDAASFSSEKLGLLERSCIIDKKLTKSFCEYILLGSESNRSEDQLIQKLNYRKKITIQDQVQSSLNLKELIQEIQIYYAEYLKSKNIELRVESNIEYIQLNLAKESFYQIIFSLIESKLHLLDQGDELKISVSQNQDELIFSMEDTGFLLSPAKMQEYTKKITEKSNLFFLSWSEVMSLLESYQYRYTIKPNNKHNHLRIYFPAGLYHSNQNKICYLADYRS